MKEVLQAISEHPIAALFLLISVIAILKQIEVMIRRSK